MQLILCVFQFGFITSGNLVAFANVFVLCTHDIFTKMYFHRYIIRFFSFQLHLCLLLFGIALRFETFVEVHFPVVGKLPVMMEVNVCFKNSSIFCSLDVRSNKLCSFHNIFFMKNAKAGRIFITIINEYSKVVGLKDRSELKTINLSSVKNHPKMYMNLQTVENFQSLWKIYLQSTFTSFSGSSNFHRTIDQRSCRRKSFSNLPMVKEDEFPALETILIDEPTVTIRRFKCDNIMHVIHDDLLPLFLTYHHLCLGDVEKCISQHRLLFIDDCKSTEFLDLYKIFTSYEPFFTDCPSWNAHCSDLKSKKLYCFRNLKAGLETSSVWYDYGFINHHGPAKLNFPNLAIVKQFFKFLIEKLNVTKSVRRSEKINVLVLNRKINRRIINVSDFLKNIQNVSSEIAGKIAVVAESDLHDNTLKNLVEQIIEADVVVGMHGSTMILSLFCLINDRTVVFELFPFGIQPKYVSFLYPLEKVLSPKIKYHIWVNEDESKSISHPDRPKLLGGIRHLPILEQSKILETKLVPPVKCCHDPMYLFRMFQDTIVGQSFLEFYHKKVSEGMHFQETAKPLNPWLYPAAVTNITCRFEDSQVLISWSTPINMFSHPVNYKIAISIGESDVFAYVVTENKFSFNLNHHLINVESKILSIWVKAFIQGQADAESTDTHSFCEKEERTT